jgi:WD40 repeat protein
MYVTKSINANHEDLIHDVAYDFYGKRMATCSSDQKVKVWDQQENGEWVCSARCITQTILTCRKH